MLALGYTCGFLIQRKQQPFSGLCWIYIYQKPRHQQRVAKDLGTGPLIQDEPEHTMLFWTALFLQNVISMASLFKIELSTGKKSPNINLQLICGFITAKINICIMMHRFRRSRVRAAHTDMSIKLSAALCGDKLVAAF